MKQSPKRHGFPQWLLSRVVPQRFREEFFGDLEELYEDRLSSRSTSYARFMYWVDALHLMLGFASRHKVKSQNSTIMLFSHLKIACRSFSRNKAYTFINLLGLSLGMGVCLIICQYLYFEWSHDRFHKEASNIYRVTLNKTQGDQDLGKDLYATKSLAEAAKAEIPTVKDFVRVYVPDEGSFATTAQNDRPITLDGTQMGFVDPSFFQVFDFPMKWGNNLNLFKDHYEVVITKSTAEKHFGFDNPLGQTLTIGGGVSHGDYIVTGVLEDLPQNSHIQFDYFFPVENYFAYGWMGVVVRWPHSPSMATYLVTQPNSETQAIEAQLDALLARNKAEWSYEQYIDETASLQPLTDIHFDTDTYANTDYVQSKRNRRDLEIFAIVGVFILVIAWVNYINMATARSIHRAKEVGIRKSVGAQKPQLISQFLVESFLLNMVAATVALGLAALVLPYLGTVLGTSLKFSFLAMPVFWLIFAGVLLIGSLISGGYPAFVLSAHQPISIFRKQKASKSSGITLRKGLIVFQFLASLFLMAGTYLVVSQLRYMKQQDLGLNMEQLLILRGPKHIEVLDGGPQLTDYSGLKAFNAYSRRTFTTFREEITRHSTIESVSGTWNIPGQTYHSKETEIRRLGEPESANKPAYVTNVGLDFIETMGLELLAGAPFNNEMGEDRRVLINEKALYQYGFKSPEEAINQPLAMFGNKAVINAVVKDFHWQSLHEEQAPWIMRFTGSTPGHILIKLKVLDLESSLDHVKSLYDQFYPGNPFDTFFMDDDFNRQYQTDQQFGNLFLILTSLAILIACIGLFALVSYATLARMKEVGIRKVLGARLNQLLVLLGKEYLLLLLISAVLALPLFWYWGEAWLDNYAFRLQLNPWLIIVPFSLVFVLAMLTVGHQTYRSAKANPVDTLRYE